MAQRRDQKRSPRSDRSRRGSARARGDATSALATATVVLEELRSPAFRGSRSAANDASPPPTEPPAALDNRTARRARSSTSRRPSRAGSAPSSAGMPNRCASRPVGCRSHPRRGRLEALARPTATTSRCARARSPPCVTTTSCRRCSSQPRSRSRAGPMHPERGCGSRTAPAHRAGPRAMGTTTVALPRGRSAEVASVTVHKRTSRDAARVVGERVPAARRQPRDSRRQRLRQQHHPARAQARRCGQTLVTGRSGPSLRPPRTTATRATRGDRPREGGAPVPGSAHSRPRSKPSGEAYVRRGTAGVAPRSPSASRTPGDATQTTTAASTRPGTAKNPAPRRNLTHLLVARSLPAAVPHGFTTEAPTEAGNARVPARPDQPWKRKRAAALTRAGTAPARRPSAPSYARRSPADHRCR